MIFCHVERRVEPVSAKTRTSTNEMIESVKKEKWKMG